MYNLCFKRKVDEVIVKIYYVIGSKKVIKKEIE